MRVFLFEYFSACDPATSAFAEGRAMLNTFINSFCEIGIQILSILHKDTPQLESTQFNSHGLQIKENPGWAFDSPPFKSLFDKTLVESDAVLVIAPETERILWKLTSQVEASGKINLGSPTNGLAKTQNKYATYQELSGRGFAVPCTYIVEDIQNIREIAHLTGYPLVVKPTEGADCQGVSLVEEEGELKTAALRAMRSSLTTREIILQEYIEGWQMSVTLIGGQYHTQPISLNEQHFKGRKPFNYTGGKAGITPPYIKDIFETAVDAWNALGELKGYGGVDLVYSKDKTYVIEVNPRPITPLVALAKCLENNLADTLLRVLNGEKVDISFRRRAISFTVVSK